jgi:Ca2+-binding RTX toxin-like protein
VIDQEFSLPMQVVPDQDMGIATGAYAAATDMVYLRESFVANGDVEAISAVIVEELGHAIDSRVNIQETPGDEGAIFSLLVNKIKVTQNLLAELRAENDWGTILVNGQRLAVEMAVINGTEFDDSLFGTEENDEINGLAGDDQLYGGDGIDSINGGEGDDYIEDINGINLVQGKEGDDYILVSIGSRIEGGEGIDSLYLTDDQIAGNVANLTFTADGVATGTDGTVINGIESFSFQGVNKNNYINAAANTYGNDFVGIGDDTFIGGSGEDSFTANTGSNIDGGNGIDTLRLFGDQTGNQGTNLTFTANGVATGTDVINGIELFRFEGGNANDYIDAGVTTDSYFLYGNGGDDTLISGAGRDYLFGGIGNNILRGGGNDDYYEVSIASGNIIDDAGGSNDDLRVDNKLFSVGDFKKSGTSLLIDVNKDKIFDTVNDISILNFYNEVGAPGTGYIERINGQSPTRIFKQSSSDFDRDLISDILWRQSDGSVTMWQMTGNTFVNHIKFSTTISTAVDASWKVVENSDFNGDGTADILWYNTSGAVSLWQMYGSTVQTAGFVSSGVDTSWQISTTGDFGGDNKTDIFWRNINGDVAIWKMDGQSIISSKVLGNVDNSWKAADTGDFNGDNQDDVLWRNDNGDVAIWLMDDNAVSSTVVRGNVSVDWKIAGVNDFNDDSKADVVWQNNDGRIALWRMDGTDVVFADVIGNISVGTNIVGVGNYSSNFDNFGKNNGDILFRTSQGENFVWTTNGTEVIFQNSIPCLDPSWTVSPAVLLI